MIKLSRLETHVEDRSPAIETIGNNIYFYSDINQAQCLQLLKAIRELDADLTRDFSTGKQRVSMPIFLHINSDGGDALAAFAVADQIEAIRSPVYSVIEGLCASAATIISLACHERYITRNSFVLIHQLSGEMWGNYEQMRDDLGMYEMLMNNLTEFYAEKTGMSIETIQDMLKHNTWLNAERCLRFGLANPVEW